MFRKVLLMTSNYSIRFSPTCLIMCFRSISVPMQQVLRLMLMTSWSTTPPQERCRMIQMEMVPEGRFNLQFWPGYQQYRLQILMLSRVLLVPELIQYKQWVSRLRDITAKEFLNELNKPYFHYHFQLWGLLKVVFVIGVPLWKCQVMAKMAILWKLIQN